MTDLSSLSNEQLQALYKQQSPAAMTDEQLRAAYEAMNPSVAADVAKSAGIGAVKGTIGMAGLPGDVQLMGRAAANKLNGNNGDWLTNKFTEYFPNASRFLQDATKRDMQSPLAAGLRDTTADVSGVAQMPSSNDIRVAVESQTGKLYEPKTTAGRYAQSVGEMAPGAAIGPGGVLPKIAMAVGGGLGGEAAGQATSGTSLEPYARVAGTLIGGYAPSAAARVITPAPASAERQRLAQILQDEGVTSLTAGQRSGNKTLQYAESILGDAPGAGAGASQIQQEGQRQFTEAAMRRAGAGPTATPEVLADNYARLGQEFRDLSARNTLRFDPEFSGDALNAIRNYNRVPPSQQRAIVENYVRDITEHATSTGTMPGAYYQEMRSRLSSQAKSLRQSDPTLSEALRDLRNALDSAMRRSISPADADAWDVARRQYGAQKILEKAASRAGEVTAEGNIVPANLRNAVTAENRGAYARGQGDFADLARAGSAVMAPLPNSGTGQRVAINSIATGLGGAAGGFSGAGGAGAALGALAGAAAPAAVGRVLMSRPVQAYLGNQLIGQTPEAVQESLRISRLANTLLEAMR